MNDQMQAELAAIRQEYEALILNVSHQCADRAAVCAALQFQLNAAKKEIEALTANKGKKA